jgi:undecaprenyl-diphosphatase
MSILQSIILAIIEGLTEFLPVSSTGHMIIASSLMGIANEPFTKAFTIAIQLGAILSVVILYFKRFFDFKDIKKFYLRLLVAFIPAMVLGLILKKIIDQMLTNVLVVAAALFIGGIIFLFVDRWFKKAENEGDSFPNNKQALITGLFQVIAMIFPGTSRSAATIIGGLSSGLNKRAAAEFSFFLAVPTMFAATCKELYDFFKDGNVFSGNDYVVLIVGNVVAFIVAMFAIKFFINFLIKHGFKWFGYYRIAIGGIILLLYFMGVNLAML